MLKITKAHPAGWKVSTDSETYYVGEYGQFGCNCNDGTVYKDQVAFDTGEGVCYVPEYDFENKEQNGMDLFEMDDKERRSSALPGNPYCATTGYTREDLVWLCGGNISEAEDLFDHVDWQSPETLLMELEDYRPDEKK